MSAPASLDRPVRGRWRERVAAALQTLQRWPWLATLATLRQRFREDRLGITASSLTFTTLISLVPLLAVMLAIFSAFPMFASVELALQKYFLQNLVPDSIAKPVFTALTQFASKANRLGVAGLGLLLVSAIALMLTIDRALNSIWRVRRPRPIAQRVLVYWATLTLGPLVLGVSLSLTGYVVGQSRDVFGNSPGGIGVLLNGVEFVVLAAAMAGLFHYVPNTHVRWAHAIAGGGFVAAGFEVAKKLLAFYIAQVPTFSLVYGAFATLPIFLVWIYLGWVIVLLGAVVAAYAPTLAMRATRWPDVPGARFELALAVLRELLRARDTEARGLDNDTLAATLRCDPLQIEPVVETLVAISWCGRLDDDTRIVLLADPARTPLAPLVEQLLLPRSAAVFWQRAGIDRMQLAAVL